MGHSHKNLIASIQFRRGKAIEWTNKDPLLDAGEPGYEENTGKFKIGDGIRTWNNLPYANSVGLDGLFATVEELNRLHNVTPGIASPNKALVVDVNNDINFNGGSLIVNNLTVEGNLDISIIDGGTP